MKVCFTLYLEGPNLQMVLNDTACQSQWIQINYKNLPMLLFLVIHIISGECYVFIKIFFSPELLSSKTTQD